MGPDRLHRLRRAADAHRAAARSLRRPPRAGSSAREFEDAIAACNLLPGPASTQLAIYCAWRLRGSARRARRRRSASSSPGWSLILALAALFLATRPRRWVLGAGAGAAPPSPRSRCRPGWRSCRRAGERAPRRGRGGSSTLLAGAAAAATVGPWLVLVLLALRRGRARRCGGAIGAAAVGSPAAARVGRHRRPAALAWVAFKVGALSYGGGFVIVPLMQHDAVDALPLDDRRRSSSTRSRSARSRPGRWCTPSPPSATRRPASAARCSPRPSPSRPRSRSCCSAPALRPRCAATPRARAFLDGAGPAAIGAILGSAIPLARALARAVAVRACSPAPRVAAARRCGAASCHAAAAPAAAGAIVALLGVGLP